MNFMVVFSITVYVGHDGIVVSNCFVVDIVEDIVSISTSFSASVCTQYSTYVV